MRANGVSELSHEGTTIRLAAAGGLPPDRDEGDETDGIEAVSRPLTADGCRHCGEPRGVSLYSDRGLCRRCGWAEQMGVEGDAGIC